MEIVGEPRRATWTSAGGTSWNPHSAVRRWVLRTSEAVAIAGVSVGPRPDGRIFARLVGDPGPANAVALLTHVASMTTGPIHTICQHANTELRLRLTAAGFSAALTEDVFSVSFESAQRAVERAWLPSDYRLVSANHVDRDELLALDNRLRQLVPGIDGWVGDRSSLDSDLDTTPPFEPDGYLIACHRRSHRKVGLVRFWRNPKGPRLGMIAVLPSHRGTTIGPALLKSGLQAASGWGSPTFITETAVTNQHAHRRLIAIGARRVGGFDVMRRDRDEAVS